MRRRTFIATVGLSPILLNGRVAQSQTNRTGTFGGTGGVAFDDSHDIDAWGRVNKLVVRHGSEVDSIAIGYANGNFCGHGGGGGVESSFDLAPDELIFRVVGRCGDRLDQISFISNKRTIGPFGGDGGNAFSADFNGATLQYLFGRSGDRIDQIGFGFGAPPPMLPSTIARSGDHGGQGGIPFDDLASQGPLIGKIRSITVRHGDRVDSIAVDYGTGSIQAHGGNGGTSDIFVITDGEWLTEIRGRSGDRLDQIQFFLSSGRVSPTYGGNGGLPFRETRANSIIKAFFGRSGSEVDQIGVYFSDVQPLSIEIISMTYDLSRLDVVNMPPVQAFETYLVNKTSVVQQMSQSASIQTSETKITSVSETNQSNVSVTFKTDFFVAGSTVSVGYSHGETATTGTSHTDSKTWTINFNAAVPANGQVKAIAVARQTTFDVPWTATAQVTYQGQSPKTMTVHGVLKGVTTTSVEAQYN